MNNCPNCGTKVSADRSTCSCGELLRADATYLQQPWETETVLRPRDAVNWNRIAAIALFAIIFTSALVLSWPQLISSWKTTNEPNAINVPQTASHPAMSGPGDLVQADNDNDGVTHEGVFDFNSGEAPQQTVKAKNVMKRAAVVGGEPRSSASADDSYDAQLLSDKTSENEKSTDKNSLPDCKPDTSTSLKRADPGVEKSETKPQPKQSGINYILGPRGGCFFVTPSGTKKYVDHSLCGSPNTAAARQD